MLIKKLAKAVSLILAVSMLLTGCSNKNDEVEELRAEIEALKAQQTAAGMSASSTEAITEAVTVAAVTEATTAATTTTTTEAAKPQLPQVAAGTYLNGSKEENAIPGYTIDASSGQEAIGTSIVVSDSLIIIVAAGLEESHCADGVEFPMSSLKGPDYVGIAIIDTSGTYEYTTLNNADAFSEATVRLYSYEPHSRAEYYIKVKGTFNGKAYDVETVESASYIEPAPPQEAAADSQQTSSYNGTTTTTPQKNCKYCKGSGICFLCNGLGYTIWGGTQNDCTSCRDGAGPGKCYYCEGTGTQVWLIRGVRIQ